MGVSIVMGVSENGWSMSGKIPIKNGWFMGVALLQETSVWLFYDRYDYYVVILCFYSYRWFSIFSMYVDCMHSYWNVCCVYCYSNETVYILIICAIIVSSSKFPVGCTAGDELFFIVSNQFWIENTLDTEGKSVWGHNLMQSQLLCTPVCDTIYWRSK